VAIDNAEHDESAAAKQLCAQITKEWASQCPGKITRIPAGIAFAGHTTSASVVQQDEPQKSQGQRFYFVRTLNVKKKQFIFLSYIKNYLLSEIIAHLVFLKSHFF